MEVLEEGEPCFPQVNTSCRRIMHRHSETIIMYSLLSCFTLLTVVLNLLVIISVSHFRQLHTTTNFLLLSLAVSDFLVGFLQLPVEIQLFGDCWLLGDFMCAVVSFVGFILTNVSIGNMVLISVDRYMAICDPMLYSTKVTLKKVHLCVSLCWIFSTFHSSWMLRDFLSQPGRYNSCYGECVVVINYVEGVVDLVVAFIGPITVIVVLYMRVFVVAVSQARAMRSHAAVVCLQHSVKAKKSEIKAARSLGVVVAVFLLCFCPYYSFTIAAKNNLQVNSSAIAIQISLIYFNSCLNPVIYTFLYPWFRKSVKHIVTLKILQPDSCEANVL